MKRDEEVAVLLSKIADKLDDILVAVELTPPACSADCQLCIEEQIEEVLDARSQVISGSSIGDWR